MTLQLTVTGPVYQPLLPSWPVTVGVITGGVWSILIVTGTELDSPAPFVAEHVSVEFPSVVRIVRPQPLEVAIPVSGSEVFQVTVTAPVYQPLVPVGPETVGTITGGVSSEPQSAVDGGLPMAYVLWYPPEMATTPPIPQAATGMLLSALEQLPN